jgi:hypothetical protein
MMARRPDAGKGVVGGAIHNRLDRRQHAARGQHRRLVGLGRSMRIGIEVVARHRGAPFHFGHVGRVVTQFQLADARLARAEREYTGASKLLGHLDHHRHALGALGMASAGEMLKITAVANQCGPEHR